MGQDLRIKKMQAFGIVLGLALTISPVVHFAGAHEGAMGIVKQRMDVMSELGKASKTIAEMFKGQRAYDPAMVAQLARNIANHADKLPAMFPLGSGNPPSEALPSVWSDRDGFVKAFGAMKQEATKLSEMAPTATQRAVMGQFFKMSRTCTACHTNYRKAK